MRTVNFFSLKQALASLMFFCLFAVASVNAQNIVTNGSFTSNTAVNTNGRDDAAFQSNRVANWACSHGTPGLIINVAPPVAWMWCMSGGTGEGIAANVNFVAGQQYTVSFRYRTKHEVRQTGLPINNQLRLNVVATSNLATGNTNTSIPATPANSEVMLTNSAVNTNLQWATMSFTYNCTRNNTKLWIYPTTVVPAGTQSELSITDISIVPVCQLSAAFSLSTVAGANGIMSITATPAQNLSGSVHTWYLFDAQCPCPSPSLLTVLKTFTGTNFAHSPLQVGKCYRLYHIVNFRGCNTVMTSKCFTTTNQGKMIKAGQDEDTMPLPKAQLIEVEQATGKGN